jgi:hypothetical protein
MHIPANRHRMEQKTVVAMCDSFPAFRTAQNKNPAGLAGFYQVKAEYAF